MASTLDAQTTLSDTIINIGPVQVDQNHKLVTPEKSGMQTTKVDSSVLAENTGTDLGELLNSNSPVFIKSNGRGAMSTASFRGTASSHTQVSWNGINLNSPLLGMVDFSQLPVFAFDEIEIFHGGASVENSSGGLGGAILLNQASNWDTLNHFSYNQGIGSYSTHHELIKWDIGNKKWNWQSKIFNIQSANDYTFINRAIGDLNPQTGQIENPLDTNHNAQYGLKGTMQAFHFKPKKNQVISLFQWNQINDRLIPRATSYEGPNNDNLNRQVLNDSKTQLKWKGHFNYNIIDVTTSFTNQNSSYFVKNNVNGLGEIPVIASIIRQNSSFNRVTYENQKWNNWRFKIDIKVDYHVLSGEDTVLKSTFKHNRYEIKPLARINYSTKQLSAQALFRQEFIDNERMPFLPFFGVDYQPLKKIPFKFTGNFSRNFRYPTINDLYWSPGGNPNLLPEQGNTFELGSTYLNQKERYKVKIQLHYFYNDIKKWILWAPSFRGYWEPQNLNKVVSKGLETNANLECIKNNWKLQCNMVYGYTKALNKHEKGSETYNKQLVYIPVHSGNINLRITYKNYHLRYQHNSYSERFTTSSNEINQRDWLYPYFMNSMAFGLNCKWKNYKFQSNFQINNLFNETYHSILYRPMPKQNYLLTLRINYQK